MNKSLDSLPVHCVDERTKILVEVYDFQHKFSDQLLVRPSCKHPACQSFGQNQTMRIPQIDKINFSMQSTAQFAGGFGEIRRIEWTLRGNSNINIASRRQPSAYR